MSEEQKKDLKSFFSIKEVAEEFGVNETLLRFWEKEFPQISPKKGGRGIRFYTRDDIEPVPYTHLTLPTKRILETSVVAITYKKKKTLSAIV